MQPDYELIKTICTYLVVPLLVAFWKSESLALDKSTKANGLMHYYLLAKQALSNIPPEDIKKVETAIEQAAPLGKP